MECRKCGHDNPVHVLFCMKCGTELSHDAATMRRTVKKENVEEGKAKTEEALRGLLTIAALLLIIAISVRVYARVEPRYQASAFISAPRVQIDVQPKLDLPMIQPRVPAVEKAKPSYHGADQSAIERLKKRLD